MEEREMTKYEEFKGKKAFKMLVGMNEVVITLIIQKRLTVIIYKDWGRENGAIVCAEYGEQEWLVQLMK